jgi:hypothetical protein
LPYESQKLWCDHNPFGYDFEPTPEKIRNYNDSKILLK